MNSTNNRTLTKSTHKVRLRINFSIRIYVGTWLSWCWMSLSCSRMSHWGSYERSWPGFYLQGHEHTVNWWRSFRRGIITDTQYCPIRVNVCYMREFNIRWQGRPSSRQEQYKNWKEIGTIEKYKGSIKNRAQILEYSKKCYRRKLIFENNFFQKCFPTLKIIFFTPRHQRKHKMPSWPENLILKEKLGVECWEAGPVLTLFTPDF